MPFQRKLFFYKNYFYDYFNELPEAVKEKTDYVLFVVQYAERIPAKFFKHIEGVNGLYEIRVNCNGNCYRYFCCNDEGNIVVLFNGFNKKTQKTPLKEIKKAKKIMQAYYQEKSISK
jgi:phage-related protein